MLTRSFTLLVGCLFVSTARADVIFDNGVPSKSGGFLSDSDSGVGFADDFLLAGPATINAIRYWGFYAPTSTPGADAFTVIFYSNQAGLPNGSGVLATNTFADAARIDTGDDIDGNGSDIYLYEAPLAPLSLGAGTYWVSIFNNTAGDSDDNWAWARHAFPGNDARSLNGGTSWLHEFSDSELSFQLLNVPEPSGLTIGLLATAMLLIGRRCFADPILTTLPLRKL
jgi:hypothetical protein